VIISVAATIAALLLTDEVTGLPAVEVRDIYELAIEDCGASDSCFVEAWSILGPKGLGYRYLRESVPHEFEWAVQVLRADTTTSDLGEMAARGYQITTWKMVRPLRLARESYEYVVLSEVGFDRENERAAVYCRMSCGRFCGTNRLVLLDREGGTWGVTKSIKMASH